MALALTCGPERATGDSAQNTRLGKRHSPSPAFPLASGFRYATSQLPPSSMRINVSPVALDALRKLAECSICLQYSTTLNVVACEHGHSICGPCAEQLDRSFTRAGGSRDERRALCPECRTALVKPHPNPAVLKNELTELLEGLGCSTAQCVGRVVAELLSHSLAPGLNGSCQPAPTAAELDTAAPCSSRFNTGRTSHRLIESMRNCNA